MQIDLGPARKRCSIFFSQMILHLIFLPPLTLLQHLITIPMERRQFGEVRKAVWKKKGLTVAVKVLKASAGSSEAADAEMQAFIEEGKTMVGLKHDFVVKLMGVVQEGQKMLVTEFMPFGAMNKYLKGKQKAGAPLPLQSLLLFVKQISEGMVYLEAKKIVHRDLAARNVLVKSDSICKISDFGMSRQVRSDQLDCAKVRCHDGST